MFLIIARSRPDHLSLISSSFTNTLKQTLNEGVEISDEEVDDTKGSVVWVELIDLLNSMFWTFYEKKPQNINIAPVCTTGNSILTFTRVY